MWDSSDAKGTRHKDAYVRFRALRAAIVRIVCRRAKERTEISSFLSGALKKVWGGILGVLGYDWSRSWKAHALRKCSSMRHGHLPRDPFFREVSLKS